MVRCFAMSGSSWEYATDMVRRFLAKPARLQHLMERLPIEEDGGKRRACQALLYGTVRHLSLLESGLAAFLKKKPKPKLYSGLLVASYEIFRDSDRSALVVDHAVEQIKRQCSRVEAGLANAVLRKMDRRLRELREGRSSDSESLATRFSHPVWMVERWLEQFELGEVQRLLEWNQSEPDLYVLPLGESKRAKLLERGFEPWKEDYLKAPDGGWSRVQEALDGKLCYVQNPGAGGAVGLAVEGLRSGRVLDLCAAPGGKSIAMATRLKAGCEVVSVDLPGSRLDRLSGNLKHLNIANVSVLGSDVFELEPSKIGLFDRVLLDAPCSNSGVLQRKVDAKWRLDTKQFAEILTLQKRMAQVAAQFVKRGGSLIYSTCSIDEEENQRLADWFCAEGSRGTFELAKSVVSLPWRDQQDGAGAFRLQRVDS